MMDYSVKGSRLGWRRIVIGLVVLLFVLVLIGGAVAHKVYLQTLQPVSAAQKSHLITIPPGTSVKEIGVILEDADLIQEAWAFEWYIRFNGLRDKMQAGTYSLRANQSVQEIANTLTQGKIATDLITILPAQRLDQIKKTLINSGFSETDVDAALNPAMYADHPLLADKPASASLEGYLYPESFQKSSSTKPEEIVRAALDEMNKQLTNEIRSGLAKQGLTIRQAVILGSIVEQEVSNPDDKRVVAQVFLRRLRENSPLGSDVTAFYGAIINGLEPTISSVAYDTPFNTRIHPGLPPGPISNVGAKSLQAVANPADTNYLFFVAGDDGKTYFSNTQAEHEALTLQHCKKLCFE